MTITLTWTLGELIRKRRIDADLEQGDLAFVIGFSRNTISNWETGRSEPGASALAKIAQATDTPIEWFLQGVSGLDEIELLLLEARQSHNGGAVRAASANGETARSVDKAAGIECTPRDLNPEPTD